MKRVILNSLLFLSVTAVLSAVKDPAQMVAKPPDWTCESSATLSVTVTDSGGAVIRNVRVLVRPIRLGGESTPFSGWIELRTNARGMASGLVPCGYIDLFVVDDHFAPHAEGLLLLKDREAVTVRLEARHITMY